MDYPLKFADQLRAHLQALRKQRGLTQAQLGQLLGLSQVRIAEIEARPGAVSVTQLLKLLSTLGAALVLRDANDTETSDVAAPATRANRRSPEPGKRSPAATSASPRGKPVAKRGARAAASSKKKGPVSRPLVKPGQGSW